MQLTIRNILIVVIVLICLREVHSRGKDPLIGKVSRYPESVPFLRDDTAEKQSVVKASDLKQSSELTSGSSFDVSANKDQHVTGNLSTAAPGNKELYPRGGQKPVNHIRRSNPIPEPTMCFQFSSRNSNEPPMTVCEPITVARQAPDDSNMVRYKPYTGLPHSSTPLVVLPPNPISQHAPTKPIFPSSLTPGYGFQPEQNRFISPLYFNTPPLRLPQSLPQNSMNQQSFANATILPPFFPSGYIFQPTVVYHTAPLVQQMPPLLPAQSLPPYPPSEVIPAKTNIFQPPLPPGYAHQPIEDRDVFAPNNYVPLLQLQSSLPPYTPSQISPAKTSILQPPFPPGYANEAAEDSGVSPPKNYVPVLQLQPNLPQYPPSQITPAKTTIPLLPFPPGYAYEAAEDRDVFPPDYYDPRRQPLSRPPLCSVTPPRRQTFKPQLPPRYGYHPLIDRSLLASNYFLSPLQVSPVLGTDPTGQVTQTKEGLLQPPASPSYGFQPAGNRDIFLDKYDVSPPQLPPSLPQNYMSRFTPTNRELQTLPPGYGYQSLVNHYTNTPYYNVPSPQFPSNLPYPPMYYVPPSPPVYVLPYSPNLFTAYGKTNKLQSPNSKMPALTSPSKSELPSTIKEQEDAHKVPTPVEETEKTQEFPSSRAVSAYTAPQYLSQEIPVSPSYGLNIVYNPNLAQPNYFVGDKLYTNSESYPNSATQFTIGQSSADVPPTAVTTDFGQSAPPAALTCKVHNSEDKEPKQTTAGDSIAILQLFLKPNPSRLNKYRQNAPGDGASNTGNSDVPDTTTSPVTQYDETKTKISSKNIMSGNEEVRGQPTIRGLVGNLKEEEIPSQRGKHFHGLKNNKDGLKGNEEKKVMQQYQEQGDLQWELGPNTALLPTSYPLVWYQGQLAPPQVAYSPDYFNAGQQTLGHRPYYETNEQQEQIATPQQLWGVPQQWWGSPQLQFWKPYYQQPTQSSPANQSPVDQHLNNQLLMKANKHGLYVQKKLSDVKHIPPLETRQERINETLVKQTRLDTVKAKLLQQYQSKAAEKKERGKQVLVSGIHKSMNSSAKVNPSELSDNIPSKLGDMEGNTLRTKLSTTRSRNSEPTEMSRENSVKLIQSTMKEILDHSRQTSPKARSMSLQEEGPVNSRKIYEENMATNDESLNAESTNDDNMAKGEKMDPMTSYLEQGTRDELEQTGNTNNESTSYPAKNVTFINSRMKSVKTNSEKSSKEEGRMDGYKTSHPEKRITYSPPARAINLKYSLTDSRKNKQHEQNVEMSPDKTSVNPSQSTEDTEFSEYGSNKDLDQSSVNINSAEVPRMKDNSEDTLISQNPSRWRESETNITTLPKEDIVPVTTLVVPIAMMTEASTKFNMQGEVTDDPALVSTPKSRSNSDGRSESESNMEDSSTTNTMDINLRYNEDNISDDIEAGELTSRDDVFTSGPRDSILSETGISSDSHKTDFYEAEIKQANTKTYLNAQNQDRDNSANDVSDSDTNTDVTVNSEATLLPEGTSASHDIDPELSSKQLLTSDSSSNGNGDLLSDGYNSSMDTTFKSKSDDTNSSDSHIFDPNDGQIAGSITDSERSFKSMDVSPVSEGTSPDLWESTAFTQDQSTNSASESSSESAEFVQETTPSIKTEPQTSTEVGAGRSSNENSDLSDEVRAISSEDGRPWEENENSSTPKSLEDSKILQEEPSEKARSSEIDGPRAVILNTLNNDDYSKSIYDTVFNSKTQTEDSEMVPDQEKESYSVGPQMNTESGFPQTPSSRMRPGHLHQGNFGNSGIIRTESFPVFSFVPSRGQVAHPSAVYPAPTRFMVYPQGSSSAPHHNYKIGPWPYAKIIPRPYAYHIPYASDHPIRYNPQFYSHIPVKNNLVYQRMAEDGTSRRAQKDVDGQTVKGHLPFVVILEE